jgi:hypothetical protein
MSRAEERNPGVGWARSKADVRAAVLRVSASWAIGAKRQGILFVSPPELQTKRAVSHAPLNATRALPHKIRLPA